MMKIARWRIVLLALLFLTPFAVLLGYGTFHLWETGWLWYFGWGMLASLSLGYFLAWFWQAKRKLLRVDFEVPMHWTERDKQAWQLVESRAKAAKDVNADQLSDFKHYAELSQDMAREIAEYYHPGSKDPVESLTIPEILAVIELVAHDMSDMVQQYVPAGHLITVRDWKRAKTAMEWYPTVNNLYWAANAIFAPYNTAMRYVATRIGMGTSMQLLQQNLLLWFYTAFIHRLGTYLIDLNSGRLRIGAERYRQLVKQLAEAEAGTVTNKNDNEPTTGMASEPDKVTITVFGQVKAGKSSLINAILGERKAETNVLPQTNEITRYELKRQGVKSTLEILDTVGYGHEGPKADQFTNTQTAAQQSDVLLLCVRAVDPGRQADVKMLEKLSEYFSKHANLKMPPVFIVVTHIDLLSPKMEWEPPYDWRHPKRPKEQSIFDAVESVKEQLKGRSIGVIPVCAAEGQEFGIKEELLPTLTQTLGEGRAVAMLRCLFTEADTRKYQRIFEQAFAGGKKVLGALLGQR